MKFVGVAVALVLGLMTSTVAASGGPTLGSQEVAEIVSDQDNSAKGLTGPPARMLFYRQVSAHEIRGSVDEAVRELEAAIQLIEEMIRALPTLVPANVQNARRIIASAHLYDSRTIADARSELNRWTRGEGGGRGGPRDEGTQNLLEYLITLKERLFKIKINLTQHMNKTLSYA